MYSSGGLLIVINRIKYTTFVVCNILFIECLAHSIIHCTRCGVYRQRYSWCMCALYAECSCVIWKNCLFVDKYHIYTRTLTYVYCSIVKKMWSGGTGRMGIGVGTISTTRLQVFILFYHSFRLQLIHTTDEHTRGTLTERAHMHTSVYTVYACVLIAFASTLPAI